MQERRSNSDRRAETRRALIRSARALFLEKGFAATGTPEIVQLAGVTRGALYHHFKDKQALFLAVVEAEAAQVAQEIEAGSSGAQSPMAALLDGARAYFKAMRQPGRVRLLLLEGPAALGVETMRRIDLETGGHELRRGLSDVIGTDMDDAQINALADMVSAMFDRAALACDAGAGSAAYEDAINSVLHALLRHSS
ncbi:TetR/AcrR family transcriptional regulator [Roseinatronobacter sp. S2]|uniref:TetR/AcrR family transcriptional regulator n=1 Tax=Roseinatronobacter sp. S2 TaxID=3035471 RepID=UPI00240F1BFD|nr:TetR/AcrR family transcriptional regulator [Roseinatronobacter sp. S2]WFE77042.1 helix-turn-helix domain containing protein [Roseinatronobacter sp. S2]